MIKSGGAIFAVGILLLATMWTPVWVQVLAYCIACVVLQYRWVLCIPAIYADAAYTPYPVTSLHSHRYLVMVLVLLCVWWLLIRFTRLGALYENKIS